MKKYIILSEDDIQTLLNEEEVYCKTDGDETLILITEKAYKEMTSITDEQWKKAVDYLNMLIVEYASIGWSGQFGLQGVLVPLRKRYESGERTKELYDAIMTCE